METGTQHGEPYPRSTASSAETGGSEEMKAKASELTHSARQRAMSTLDEQKAQVCTLLDRTADTIQDDRVGRYAAEYARRGAQYLRTRSADELVSSFRSELRARPGLLLSACFVAGLAIARVVRGSRDENASFRERPDERWREPPHGWQGEPGWRGDEP